MKFGCPLLHVQSVVACSVHPPNPLSSEILMNDQKVTNKTQHLVVHGNKVYGEDYLILEEDLHSYELKFDDCGNSGTHTVKEGINLCRDLTTHSWK